MPWSCKCGYERGLLGCSNPECPYGDEEQAEAPKIYTHKVYRLIDSEGNIIDEAYLRCSFDEERFIFRAFRYKKDGKVHYPKFINRDMATYTEDNKCLTSKIH